MVTDDDSTSRDSGICELMDENAPVCFSSLTGTSYEVDEPMEVDDEPEVTKPQKKVPLRRQKSCQIRLFDELPTTPTLPRFPSGALTLRDSNLQDPFNRKRMSDDADYGRVNKIVKSGPPYDHYHLESSLEIPDEEETSKEALNDEIIEVEGRQYTSDTPFAVPMAHAKRKKKLALTHYNTDPMMNLNGEEDDDEEVDNDDQKVDYHLVTTGSRCSSSFRRIPYQTLMGLLREMSDEDFKSKYLLVDCRYPFEYEKGHIKHAVNYYNPENVQSLFYGEGNDQLHSKIPIFYCEFSQKRGPSMANALRRIDRQINESKYPLCHYKEMYVLDKGYREFFQSVGKLVEKRQEFFSPEYEYVEMSDNRYACELKKYSFHKRYAPGFSVFRSVSDTSNICPQKLQEASTSEMIEEEVEVEGDEENTARRSSPPPSQEIQVQQHQVINTTPGIPRMGLRTASARQLFVDHADSPTNYDRNVEAIAERSPPTVKTPCSRIDFGHS
ncbi:CRE-CDC-25.2 protein [Caenorhabditis remanei]|uniref:protein-tyrosine-phosphatase n=1 Tax=Caenorhabditis remanei TaxID=31234 RepID=E3LK60_CAERE|nr:CRE-CDC-25.2 protein [Caenorhabditis remanei]